MVTIPPLVQLAAQTSARAGLWKGLAVLALWGLPRLVLAITHLLTAIVALYHRNNARRREARQILFRHPLMRPPCTHPHRTPCRAPSRR